MNSIETSMYELKMVKQVAESSKFLELNFILKNFKKWEILFLKYIIKVAKNDTT